ncbi:MAG TPA: chemotaxis protein CheC [Candidatus Saccharimonadales bacterium]|nr:chemotaxis protein CheC [Candidatus Saccharimonadales bacterium]
MKLQLSPLEHDILTEVATIGAGHAIGPISKMINMRIDVTVPTLEMMALEAVADTMGAADQDMTAVIVKIRGDAAGTIMLLMEPNAAQRLVRPIAGGQEASALEEIGNILAGSALGALGHFLGLTFMQSVPGSATDMVRAMVNEITAELGAKTDHILVLTIRFVTETGISGTLYFLFDPASTQKILVTARTVAGGTNAAKS